MPASRSRRSLSSPERHALLAELAEIVTGHRRVAVDGVDAAGKTILADQLAAVLRAGGLSVARVSADDFLPLPEHRYRRGELSPEGYYRDGHDHDAIAEAVAAATAEVVVVDGVFLRRPELDARWDLRVLVEVDEDVALERALVRDAERFGGREAARMRYLARYVPARALYRAEAAPADVVVENTDPERPRIVR